MLFMHQWNIYLLKMMRNWKKRVNTLFMVEPYLIVLSHCVLNILWMCLKNILLTSKRRKLRSMYFSHGVKSYRSISINPIHVAFHEKNILTAYYLKEETLVEETLMVKEIIFYQKYNFHKWVIIGVDYYLSKEVLKQFNNHKIAKVFSFKVIKINCNIPMATEILNQIIFFNLEHTCHHLANSGWM